MNEAQGRGGTGQGTAFNKGIDPPTWGHTLTDVFMLAHAATGLAPQPSLDSLRRDKPFELQSKQLRQTTGIEA
ncbi:hypothetical protein THAR02_07300 [Trichoderma harzianum]|uniref:Uncharacterized protein n=1 Tax=Trichoderma harzianum TaxID=5544 RepID=A0A0F9XJG4_TRIHA|nr:hypothetical protein THAR02_07300 [Trichoderma harzianum]